MIRKANPQESKYPVVTSIIVIGIAAQTIIIATHDDALIALADRIISFDEGKIVEIETQSS